MAGHISKNLMATSNKIWPHLPYMATVGNTDDFPPISTTVKNIMHFELLFKNSLF